MRQFKTDMLMNVKMFILWGFLFIYGCQTKETLPFLSFETDLKGENNDFFNRYYQLSEVIPLETNDSSLMGYIGKIIAAEDYLFIMDGGKTGIWIFDRSGKFVRKIDKPGRGPGEYVRMGDFMVSRDSQQVIVYDRIGKLNYYDWEGRFLYDRKAGLYFEQVENLPDGGWVTNHGFMHNVKLRDTAYVIIASDADMKPVAGVARYPNVECAVPIRITSGLFQDQGRCFVIPLTENTIYEYLPQDTLFVPRYGFKIGNSVLPDPDHLTDQDILKGFFKDYFLMYGQYIGEKTVWVSLGRLSDSKFNHLIGDKKTGKVYPLPYKLKDEENQIFLTRDFQQAGFEGKLVFYATAISITGMDYKNKNSQGYRLSTQLKDEDNPVLFLYEEK